MMKKKITSSQKPKVLKQAEPKAPQVEPKAPQAEETVNPGRYAFPAGAKFVLDNIVFTVKKAFVQDNADMRLLHSENGEEFIMLSSLQRDAVESNGRAQFTLIK